MQRLNPIKTERNESIAEIKQQVASLVVEAAEKILAGKIDIEKDNKVVEEAIKGLK
jgi:F0F1-type ATP synthase membrane subunit b/b'